MTKLAASGDLMGRAVEEWVGKTPDSIPPPHVYDRIWLRCSGKCHITKKKIRPGDKWQWEHPHALKDGGENRESNIAPALDGAHKEKTAEESSQRAVISRKRQKNNGIKAKSPWRPLMGTKASGWKKKFDGTVERRT